MTPPLPLEIELKLILPPDQVPAFLKRMRRRRCVPDEQDLVTLYFDTPDFGLSARGVALRVRRAGRGWVQTLKTEGERQGGLSRRIEFETATAAGALDWARLPPAAQHYVPVALRAALAPVFETHFHRTAWTLARRGGHVIEVALDVGEVRAGTRREPLCEIELELKAGAPGALFDLALDWAGDFGCLPFDVSKAERGVRLAHRRRERPVHAAPLVLNAEQTVEEGLAAVLQNCLAHFQANLPALLYPAAGDEDAVGYVHQARVALRRLRAALRVFHKVRALPDTLAAPLRAMADALGGARDADVARELATEALADGLSAQDIVDAAAAHALAERAALRVALGANRPGAWLLAMQRWLNGRGVREASAPVVLGPWAHAALARGQRRLQRDAAADVEHDAAARHRVRLAIKRQRYVAEFFAGLDPTGEGARYLDALRAAQERLGRANDAHVALSLLRGVAPVPAPMAAWFEAREREAAREAVRHVQAVLKRKPGP